MTIHSIRSLCNTLDLHPLIRACHVTFFYFSSHFNYTHLHTIITLKTIKNPKKDPIATGSRERKREEQEGEEPIQPPSVSSSQITIDLLPLLSSGDGVFSLSLIQSTSSHSTLIMFSLSPNLFSFLRWWWVAMVVAVVVVFFYEWLWFLCWGLGVVVFWWWFGGSLFSFGQITNYTF